MSWVKLDDTFAEDPRWDDPGADGLALHVAALCYANRNLTDGVVGRTRLRVLFPVTDPDATTAALIAAGVWVAEGDDAVRLVGYHETQPKAEDVLAKREEWKQTQRRNRAHKAGDHSMCTRGRVCPNGALSRKDTPSDTALESSHPAPAPAPVPEGIRERKREGRSGIASPATTSQGRAPSAAQGADQHAAVMDVQQQGFRIVRGAIR